MLVKVLFLAVFLAEWTAAAASDTVCYFPQQYQGEFVMQTTNLGSGIQYATVNVTAVSIPIWGNCYRRIGNNFILMLNFRDTTCVRCLHLKLRSSNVLQVFTMSQEMISKCFLTPELAEAHCPSEESLANRNATEILLFKTKDASGLYTRKEYCPIDGKFTIKYNSYNPRKLNECKGYDSSMDSCPSGSILNFRLRGCSYDNYDLRFECLGGWRGPNNEHFLIFTDNRQSVEHKAKYRCALYNQDYKTGEIQMALSRDSSCSNGLSNSTTGFETFLLTPKPESPWPAEASSGTCSFPKWMHGLWEHVRVNEDTMIYKDHTSFKTYTVKCVGALEDEGKYLIFSRTQCDEEKYNCMRVVKRSNNIMEFQMGVNSSDTNDVFTLCSEENFQDDSWITQGRTDTIKELSAGKCPISGEYVGVIPDGEDLCAKLWSDCDTSELMYYQVSHCKTHEIYEEREYKCLGHWREAENLYTYTQRRDVAAGTYECFVGVKISNREIYINEAGEHCQRHLDPLHYGMQLNKTSLIYSCNYTTPRLPPSYRTSPRTPLEPHKPVVVLPPVKSTTVVWNFDTEGVQTKKNDNSSSAALTATYLMCIFVNILKLYV